MLDLIELGGDNDRVSLGELLSTRSLVVIIAVMGFAIAMLRAVNITAMTFETGKSDLLPAREAASGVLLKLAVGRLFLERLSKDRSGF